jgi:hypothetical protein
MAVSGFIVPAEKYFDFFNFNLYSIILFASLLLFTTIPWLYFDKKIINFDHIVIYKVKSWHIIYRVCITFSFLSMLYILPYAMIGFLSGADVVRGNISEGIGVLPQSPFTTIAVAVGLISPYFIFLFFITFIDLKFAMYRIFIFIASFNYIITSMAFTARDGYIIFLLMYLSLFLVFRKFFLDSSKQKMRKFSIAALVLLALVLGKFTIERFSDVKGLSSTKESLLSGSIGYFSQQPFVFCKTVELQNNFHGFSLRFPLINSILLKDNKTIYRTQRFETMFGTWLSEFYSVSGYGSLIIIVIVFILVFYLAFRYFIYKQKHGSLLLAFVLYTMLMLQGLFYFRLGSYSGNQLVLSLLILPFISNLGLKFINKR